MKAFASHADAPESKQHATVSRSLPAPVTPISTVYGDGALLQRKANCACGGGCPSCAEERQPETIQTKLQLSTPGDQYEQEADRVADQILRMPESSIQLENAPAPMGNSIQRLPMGEVITPNNAAGKQLDSSGGRSLLPSTRQFMEPRFDADFSHVRVHDDQHAHKTASQFQARAFTSGHHIWLGAKESENDKSLMVHELTHVVQQSRVASGTSPQPIQRQTLVGTENQCVAYEDRALNVGAGTPLSETTTPGGRVIPGTRGSQQNCAGASLCGRSEYINWPFLGLEAADGVSRPGMTADWMAANYFVPSGCGPVNCNGININVSRCGASEREVILFLYRWPAGVVRGTSTTVYQSDFHMIGRTPSSLPMAWESKMDRRERVEDIRDPWQSLYDAYPHTRLPDRQIMQHCFCCDCGKIVTR